MSNNLVPLDLLRLLWLLSVKALLDLISPDLRVTQPRLVALLMELKMSRTSSSVIVSTLTHQKREWHRAPGTPGCRGHPLHVARSSSKIISSNNEKIVKLRQG